MHTNRFIDLPRKGNKIIICFLIVLLLIGIIVGSIFLTKKNKNTKKNEIKTVETNEYLYPYAPIETLDHKTHLIEYKKDINNGEIEKSDGHTYINDFRIEYNGVEITIHNKKEDKTLYHIASKLLIINETSKEELLSGYTIVDTIDDYYILQTYYNKINIFKMLYKEYNSEDNNTYYYGLIISDMSSINTDDLNTIEEAKEVINNFEKDTNFYTCEDIDKIETCKDKNDKPIDKKHTVEYYNYKKKN